MAQPSLAINSQPADVSTTPGATAKFHVGTTGAATIQWQHLDANGQWLDIPGATGADLVLTGLTVADDGDQFRAQVKNSAGGVVLTSSAVMLRVTATPVAPSVLSQPVDLQVRVGQVPRFTVTAAGTALTYQWQTSADGRTWTDMPGATAETLELPAAVLTDSGRLYRIVVSNTLGSVTSRAVILGVQPAVQIPVFTAQPQDRSVEAGQGTTFTATSSGEPAPALQWESSLDGSAWLPVAGATSSTLVVAATTLADNGRLYRCAATNSEGSVTSAAAKLTVTTAPSLPVFVLVPQAATVVQAQPVTFEAQAAGTPTPTYQWQVSVDNGATFTNINGATAGQLTLATTTEADQGKLFRVIASNRVGDVTSVAVRLTVYSPPQVTAQPTDVTSGVTDAAVTLSVTATGYPAPSVQWQASRDEGGSYQDVAGATSTTFTWSPTQDDDKQLLRARLSNAAGTTYSQAARVHKARWTYVSPSFVGTSLNAVRWLDTQVAVAVGNEGVIVRTTDAGASWQFVREPMADLANLTQLAVLDAHTVVTAGPGGALLRSDDAGATWSTVSAPTTGWINSMSFRNASIGVLNSYDDGLFRTLDGGRTWARVMSSDPDVPLVKLNYVALRGMLGFATSDNNWYRSADGGASWQAVSIPAGVFNVGLGYVAFADDQTLVITGGDLVRSEDGGQTWQTVSEGSGPPVPAGLVRFSADGQVGIDATGHLRSVDGGKSWSYATPPYYSLHDLDFGTNGVALGAGANGELTRSTDLGATWTAPYKSQGLDDVDIWGLEFPGNDVRGIAFGNQGSSVSLYQTSDGGTTWQPLTQFTYNYLEGPTNTVTQFVDADVGMATYDHGPLLRTTDGGRTWQEVHTSSSIGNNTGFAMIDRDTLVECSEFGIFRSSDGGANWTKVLDTYGTTNDASSAAQIVGARGHVVLAPTLFSKFYRSVDGGQTWSTTSWAGGGLPVSMAWSSDSTVFVLEADGALFRSDDAGLNWRQMIAAAAPPNVFSTVKFSADGQMGIVVGTNVIYRSSDGGATWNRDLARSIGWWNAAGFAGSRSPVVAGDVGSVAIGSGY